MKRICIIGNSHIAALKFAWDELSKEYETCHITFFGTSAVNMFNTKIRNRKLVPTNEYVKNSFLYTSQGQDKIDFSLFDIIVVIGVGCLTLNFYPVLDTHRSVVMPTSPLDILSEACAVRVYRDCFAKENNPTFSLLSKIRPATQLPIFLILPPFWSYRIAEQPDYKKVVATNCEAVQHYYYAGINEAYKNFQVTLLKQPEETVVNHVFTRSEFSDGAIGLGKTFATTNPEKDFVHMNANYGKIVLSYAIERIFNC